MIQEALRNQQNKAMYLFDISKYDNPQKPQYPFKGYPDHSYYNWASIHGMAQKMIDFNGEMDNNDEVRYWFIENGTRKSRRSAESYEYYTGLDSYLEDWIEEAWMNDIDVCFSIISDFCMDWCRWKGIIL